MGVFIPVNLLMQHSSLYKKKIVDVVELVDNNRDIESHRRRLFAILIHPLIKTSRGEDL
jgi:hypothetical protein